jgi:hypothetical protein
MWSWDWLIVAAPVATFLAVGVAWWAAHRAERRIDE